MTRETTAQAPDAGAVELRDDLAAAIIETLGLTGEEAEDAANHPMVVLLEHVADMRTERDRLAAERETDAKLAAYGLAVLRLWHYDEDRYDLDGGDVQEIAVQTGVVAAVRRATPCGEHCACAEVSQRGETVDCLVIAPDVLARLNDTARQAGEVDDA